MAVDRLAPSEAAGWRRDQEVRPSSADLPCLSRQSSCTRMGASVAGVWQVGQRETMSLSAPALADHSHSL
jgi:hypothetical protein